VFRVAVRRFQVAGEARSQHPDVTCRWQIEHAEGAVLPLVLGPDGDHGQCCTGDRVDPLCARQRLFVCFRIQEGCRALASAFLESFVEYGEQVES
jgi:hypothetical protein